MVTSHRISFVEQAREVASWTPRRHATALRLVRTARAMAADRGFDEFTLDDLAERAGVSRRSLFNYFPSKMDAVLGVPPRSCAAAIDAFAAGGPAGDLLDDAVAVVHTLIADKDMAHEDWVVFRRALDRNSKLTAAAIERFRLVGSELAAMVAAREGVDQDGPRARVLVAMLAAIFEVATTTFETGPPDADLRGIFDEHLAALELLVTAHRDWRAGTHSN